ncbi:MAG TPA: DUF3015 family protein [Nitrospira sp.]
MKTSAALFIPMLLMGGVSCGPTTDTLQAPFDITSSTSPGNSAPTGPAKARQQLERFVAYAYDSVSGDIAQGHGEYLTSLAVLAGVPAASQNAFRAEMQSRYAVLYDPVLSRKEAGTLVVNHAWSAGYGRTENGHNPSAASGS